MSFDVVGDLALNEDSSDVYLVQGIEEIAESVNNALQIIQGSWRYDLTKGFAWDLFEKAVPLALWRSQVWKKISSIDGIRSVTNVIVSLDRPARKLRIDWSAKTVAGTATSYVEFT